MNDRFKDKYRIESTRLQNWDYASSGAYYVTICTKNKEQYFGDIQEGKMKLSSVGIIASVLWYEIANHMKDIELGEFVVMPNHIHCVIYLLDNESTVIDSSTAKTRHALSLQNENNNGINVKGNKRFQNQGKKSLSSIIGSYKSAVTKYANKLNLDFAWQPRFYEHIIRNEESLHNIIKYIENNPTNWKDDEYY